MYKRQTYGRALWRQTDELTEASEKNEEVWGIWRSVGAVSYTHLDVYKRQTQAYPISDHITKPRVWFRMWNK